MLVSYAQNREDLYLYALVGEGPGFYVDVGANHPTQHSVTQFFYDRGWSGINIEPNATLAAQFDAVRPRDVNLNLGISDHDGSMTFRVILEAHGLSTFDPKLMDQLARSGHAFEDREVDVTTLANVLGKYASRGIDFMKVDTEGHEMAVLRGNDWLEYRPRCLVVEGGIHAEYIPFLDEQGYRTEFFDGLNYYFVDDRISHDLSIHRYCERVLSHGFVPAAADAQIRSLSAEVARLQVERDELAARLVAVPVTEPPHRTRLQRFADRLAT